MKKRIISIFAAFLICISTIFAVACDSTPTPNPDGGTKTITKIEMESLPNKVDYYVGEAFDITGASIKETYDDGTSAVKTLPADGYEISSPNMEKTGEKTVTVSLTELRKRATFKITVANQGFKLTCDLNYEGAPAASVISVVKGTAAKKPSDPVREGFTFYKWYLDKNRTEEYDFDTLLNGDLTIYAEWKDNSVEYAEVTYDVNYYGTTPRKYTQIVKKGEKARSLSNSPERAEYKFDGWFTNEDCTTSFDIASLINDDLIVYAKWTKTKTGTSTYTFEAEQTNLKGKTGPGFSGTASEEGMIVSNPSASNGKCISFMYKTGNSLEFYIASDAEVTDAKLTISLAAEMDNVNFNSQEFLVTVNDVDQSYDSVSLVNGADFSDAIVISGVTLKKGANLIVLKTNNSKRPMGEGSTYTATAPMIDCIKIQTSAVLIWDANFDLPKKY